MSFLMEPIELVAGIGVVISGTLGIMKTKVGLWRIPFALFILTGVFMSFGAALGFAQALGALESDGGIASSLLSLGRVLLILSIAFLTYMLALLYDRSHINVLMLPKKAFGQIPIRLRKMYGKAGAKHVLYSMGNESKHIRLKEALMGWDITQDSFPDWLPSVYTLFGWGSKLTVESYVPGEKIVIRTHGNFEVSENGIDGVPTCDFTRGLFAGLGKALSSNMDSESIETKCESRGDEYCQFEVNFFPRTIM